MPPSRHSSQRRLVRTIVLGAVAVFAAIWWLSDALGMDRQELLDFAFTGLWLVLSIVVLALAGAALVRGLKWLFRRSG